MTFVHIHSASPYGLPAYTQKTLLGGLSLMLLMLASYLLALVFYMAWSRVARCYQQLRGGGWSVHPAFASTSSISSGCTIRRVTLYSAPDWPRPLLSLLVRRCKLCMRHILYPRQTRCWLAFWNRTATHRALALATPRLLHKIYRPYMSLQMRCPERRAMLMSHYDFIIRRGLAPLVLQASQQRVPVGQFNGKSGDLYGVQLGAIASLDHEGELALYLYRGDQLLFSTAFTICHQQGSWVIHIGCLQGSGSTDSRDQIRRATRDMFGLRPKDLMIRLVRSIGMIFGCSRMVLISNGNRVANRRRKRGRVRADYDTFWQEIGAARRQDGDYELPCTEPKSRINESPSRKRAEARQRQALARQATQEVGRMLLYASR